MTTSNYMLLRYSYRSVDFDIVVDLKFLKALKEAHSYGSFDQSRKTNYQVMLNLEYITPEPPIFADSIGDFEHINIAPISNEIMGSLLYKLGLSNMFELSGRAKGILRNRCIQEGYSEVQDIVELFSGHDRQFKKVYKYVSKYKDLFEDNSTTEQDSVEQLTTILNNTLRDSLRDVRELEQRTYQELREQSRQEHYEQDSLEYTTEQVFSVPEQIINGNLSARTVQDGSKYETLKNYIRGYLYQFLGANLIAPVKSIPVVLPETGDCSLVSEQILTPLAEYLNRFLINYHFKLSYIPSNDFLVPSIQEFVFTESLLKIDILKVKEIIYEFDNYLKYNDFHSFEKLSNQ